MRRCVKRSGIEVINFLNWLPYNKHQVKEELDATLGWSDYGGKHHESIWTRLYQRCLLPEKLGQTQGTPVVTDLFKPDKQGRCVVGY